METSRHSAQLAAEIARNVAAALAEDIGSGDLQPSITNKRT